MRFMRGDVDSTCRPLCSRRRADRIKVMSVHGTSRTCRDVRLESVMRTKAEVERHHDMARAGNPLRCIDRCSGVVGLIIEVTNACCRFGECQRWLQPRLRPHCARLDRTGHGRSLLVARTTEITVTRLCSGFATSRPIRTIHQHFCGRQRAAGPRSGLIQILTVFCSREGLKYTLRISIDGQKCVETGTSTPFS
jgi:hypothetical protein